MCGYPLGPDTDQATHTQGKFFIFEIRVKLTLRFSFVVSENDGPYQVCHQRMPVGIRRSRTGGVLTRRERTARRKAALEDEVEKAEKQETIASQVEEPPAAVHRMAAERAAAGLVQPDVVQR